MNEDTRFKVTFNGQIVSGHAVEQVKVKLTLLFNSTATTIEKLFSGKIITIKKDLTAQKAKNYQKAMENAGAIATIQAMHEIKEEVKPEVKITQANPTNNSFNDDELPPPPMAVTTASTVQEEEEKEEPLVSPPVVIQESKEEPEDQFSAPPSAEVTNAADPLGIAPAEQWDMDELGSRMSKPKAAFTKPLPLTEHLDLSPPKTEVGQIKRHEEAVNPDTSYLGISMLGEDLSDPKTKENLDTPDISYLNMAEIGMDMGQAIDIKEEVDPDISQYNLAETGSDMGQMVKEKELLNPDTSHLDLED